MHKIKKFKARNFIVAAGTLMIISGCEMLESHPYDAKVTGEKHLTSKNIAQIQSKLANRQSFVFAMISDTQRGYDETVDVVNAINRRSDIDFVVHGGDMSEYGTSRELIWARDVLNQLNVPYISVIGNHDCLATGIDVYKTLFGELNYSFSVGDVKFLCLNTNALEFDYSTAVPDFQFLKNELASLSSDISRTIVLMHARPFSEQFNNNIAHEFHSILKCFPNLMFCLYGHGHHVRADELFGDSIMYYECANIKKRSYLLFSVKQEGGYDYEVIEF